MTSRFRNILMFSSWFPNRVQATNGNFVEKHIRLIARSYPVTVFQVEYDPNLPFASQEWVETQQDNYHLLTIYFGNTFGKIGRLLYRLFLSWRAFVYLKKVKTFDLLHVHIAMPGAILGCFLDKIYKIPFVLSCHSSGFLSYNPRAYPRWQRRFLMFCANKAIAVFPVSEALEEALRSNGLDTNCTCIIIIPNVVNTKIFTRSISGHSFDDTPLRILHISNFHPQAKNVEGILRVAKKLEIKGFPFLLSIAGDGDLDRIKAYGKSLGVSNKLVHFHGTLQEKEVAEMMQNHHVFLLFSNYETQGVTLLEAQCMGMPIIATNIGGIPEIVYHAWMGELVEPKDEEALCHAIETFSSHIAIRTQKKILEDARWRYSEEGVDEKFKTVYLEIFAELDEEA